MNQKNLTMTMIRILSAGKICMIMMICIINRKAYKHINTYSLMAEVDLDAGLRSLRQSLQQIRSLLAWEQLKQSEARPSRQFSFQIYDPTETDLRNEYSFFISISVQMHSILNDNTLKLKETERHSIKMQLMKIEQQVHGLNLHQRYLKSVQ